MYFSIISSKKSISENLRIPSNLLLEKLKMSAKSLDSSEMESKFY
jgi:hypothetical protein